MGGSISVNDFEQLSSKVDVDFFNIFVESGTFIGETSLTMRMIFNRVKTIELSKELYEENIKLYGDIENIDFYFGDSRVVLPKIIEEISNQSGVVFFLDGHYSGLNAISDEAGKMRNDAFYNTEDNIWKKNRWLVKTETAVDGNVPLYDELDIIVKNFEESCIIIIDDVRLFGKIYEHGDWSSVNIENIMNRLDNRGLNSFIESDRLVLSIGKLL